MLEELFDVEKRFLTKKCFHAEELSHAEKFFCNWEAFLRLRGLFLGFILGSFFCIGKPKCDCTRTLHYPLILYTKFIVLDIESRLTCGETNYTKMLWCLILLIPRLKLWNIWDITAKLFTRSYWKKLLKVPFLETGSRGWNLQNVIIYHFWWRNYFLF